MLFTKEGATREQKADTTHNCNHVRKNVSAASSGKTNPNYKALLNAANKELEVLHKKKIAKCNALGLAWGEAVYNGDTQLKGLIVKDAVYANKQGQTSKNLVRERPNLVITSYKEETVESTVDALHNPSKYNIIHIHHKEQYAKVLSEKASNNKKRKAGSLSIYFY